MLRTFNFKSMRGCKERKIYYVENYNKQISEDEFVEAVRSWKKKKYRNSNTRSISSARRQYKMLKKVYGFFT